MFFPSSNAFFLQQTMYAHGWTNYMDQFSFSTDPDVYGASQWVTAYFFKLYFIFY